jgi:hypothetical protein
VKKIIHAFAAAAALCANSAFATFAIPATDVATKVTFTEAVGGGQIAYTVTNQWAGESIVAFAISTGPVYSPGQAMTSTTQAGWSSQLTSNGLWQAGGAGFLPGNPFAAYVLENKEFAAAFNGVDQNAAIFWLDDKDAGHGISFGETASGFNVFQVFNASDIVVLTASGNAYKSGGITASIPEPSTYALMAACLGVVAVATRRRA